MKVVNNTKKIAMDQKKANDLSRERKNIKQCYCPS